MKLRSKSFILSIVLSFILMAVLLCVFVACDEKTETTRNDDGDCAIISIDNEPVDANINSYTIEVDPIIYNIDLHERIEVTEGCSWSIYKDSSINEGCIIFQDRITNLQYGNNKFYIVVTRGGASAKSAFYTLNIYRNFYTDIKYYVNGELYKTVPNVLSHTYRGVILSIDVEGYTLNGWKYNDKVFQDILYIDSQNIELHAVLEAKKYTLTLDPDNGIGEQNVQVVDYDKSFKLPCPEKVGHRFVGWAYDGEFLTDSMGNSLEKYNIAEKITLKAVWEKNKYHVYIAKNIDVAGEIQMQDGNDDNFYDYQSTHTVTATTNPDYVFVGWYKDGNLVGLEPSLTFTVEDSQTVIMAKWCKVSFKSLGKNMGEIVSIESSRIAGGEATISVTTNLGYEFMGVYDGEKLVYPAIGQVVTITLPSEDKTYTAKWAVKDEMSNFDFVSTADLCEILNVKDKSALYITIPEYVTGLARFAFEDCVNIKRITIPNTITSIGFLAFDSCISLESIEVGAENPKYHSKNNCLIETETKTLLLGCKTSVIPDDGSVTSIGNYAFYYCTGLISVVIPSGVTSIGADAFRWCKNLEEIVIPNSVTSIGDTALAQSGLTSIVIPNSVLSIGRSAFVGCFNLESVTLSNNIKAIEEHTFLHCKKLKEIDIPKGVTSIGDYAFYGCSNLTSVNIPESVTSIDRYAFNKCTALTDITIPSGVTTIGDIAFYGCENLARITIPDSVTSIGEHAFEGCTSLTNVTIPASAISAIPKTNLQMVEITSGDSIGDSAFKDCKTLTSVTICDGITSIEDYAFSGCENLASITIPDSVTSIGEYAFRDCTQLMEIVIPNNVTSIGSCAFSQSGLTSIVIPNSVLSIGSAAFLRCYNLESVTMSNSIKTIAGVTFNSCKKLKKINIPEGVTSIGDYAFTSCSSLVSVMIPNSVSNIGSVAFGYCSSLVSITVPDGVTTIGISAFFRCSALRKLIISDSVTDIGLEAFAFCSSLESITVAQNNPKYYSQNNCIIDKEKSTLVVGCKTSIIPNNGGVVFIGSHAFWGCSELKSIVIPSGVKHIGDSAFSECSGLESVVIPSGVVLISSRAFYNCSSLASITIPDTVAGIGKDSFEGCTSLISATMPTIAISVIPKTNLQTVVITSGGRIVDNAFQDCKTLTSVTICDGITSIGDNAFSGCENLANITLPESVTLIADTAFASCQSLVNVTYGGTVEEWKSAQKDMDKYSRMYVIHCTDGDILPDSTVVSNQDTAA